MAPPQSYYQDIGRSTTKQLYYMFIFNFLKRFFHIAIKIYSLVNSNFFFYIIHFKVILLNSFTINIKV